MYGIQGQLGLAQSDLWDSRSLCKRISLRGILFSLQQQLYQNIGEIYLDFWIEKEPITSSSQVAGSNLSVFPITRKLPDEEDIESQGHFAD